MGRKETPRRAGEDVTIYEVAQRAHVSIATVSFVINRPDRVRSSTRERVLKVIDELGYVPKLRAVVQARAGFGRVAVVAPFSSYASFSRCLNGIIAELDGTNTQVLVYDHEDVASSSSPLLSSLPVRGHVDGIIIMGIPIDESVAERLKSRMPTVLVDWRQEGLASISNDDFLAGQLVGRHFRDTGHKRVAFVGEIEVPTLAGSPIAARLAGLRDKFGQDGVVELSVPRGVEAGVVAVDLLLDADARPTVTGVFAHRDLLALGMLKELRHRGVSIPDDVAVIGCGDDSNAEAIGLSSITIPFEESGRQAVRGLQRLAGGAAADSVNETLPPLLTLRDTTNDPDRRAGAEADS